METTVDAAEVAKFEAMAAEWWDPHGKFKPLHMLNPCRLDYIVADALALADFLKGQGKDCCKRIAEVKRDDAIHGAGVAGAVRKSDTALKALVDKAIAETVADGSLKKLEDKWFKFE